MTKLKLSENAEEVLRRRYFLKDKSGNPIEDADAMFRRVAHAVAQGEPDESRREEQEKKFYLLMQELKFLPNSPTLMNAGKPGCGQLSACFVLPVEDSIEGIFDAVKHAAMVHKSGGGTGFSFSRIRPAGSRVGSTGGVASGPVSFMKIFNTATEQIKQGGTRRGANMGILRIDHPDILDFIRAKDDTSELTNFNISVGITDEFMAAVLNDTGFWLRDPSTGATVREIRAKELFDAVVEHAWRTGEPGVIFLDTINRDNPTPNIGEIEATNPCGEQPLLPYEACNLGSLNLSKFVDVSALVIDYLELGAAVETAVDFLDDVVSISEFPLPQITERVRSTRKIGLGVMGWADALCMFGIPYGSDEACELAETVMDFIQMRACRRSCERAAAYGAFPMVKESVYADEEHIRPRNATLTTIAPTGTLSIIADCSSGIEPLFALSMTKHVMDDAELPTVNRCFESDMKNLFRDNTDAFKRVMDEVARTGSCRDCADVPSHFKDIYAVAGDIAPAWHVRMQAAFQKHTDNAVSKTVNLPFSATPEDIANVYRMAHAMHLKGVTVYRDGCRAGQVLTAGESKAAPEKMCDTEKPRDWITDRPDVLHGTTTRLRTGLGTMYVTVNEVDGKPVEVFATIGKCGHSVMAKTEAIGRLASIALQHGVTANEIAAQLEGIGGDHAMFRAGGMVLSVPDGIAKVLSERYPANAGSPSERDSEPDISGVEGCETCPECGEKIVHDGGCAHCPKCGWSRCA